MSDNMRNRPGADQGNNSRMSDENFDNRKRYDGFEGMNYEQIRQPYDPQYKDGKRNTSDSQGNNNRREDV
jgi:hypothetical protein